MRTEAIVIKLTNYQKRLATKDDHDTSSHDKVLPSRPHTFAALADTHPYK